LSSQENRKRQVLLQNRWAKISAGVLGYHKELAVKQKGIDRRKR